MVKSAISTSLVCKSRQKKSLALNKPYSALQKHTITLFLLRQPTWRRSDRQCATWIEALHQQGKKVLFDSSKAALRAGIEAHPWLVKPNDEELSDFVGEHLATSHRQRPLTQQCSQCLYR